MKMERRFWDWGRGDMALDLLLWKPILGRLDQLRYWSCIPTAKPTVKY
jgi:hypothetical protein